MQVKEAMILAAGFSTRLRPLTDSLPKPLLPFWNRTILDFTLAYLKSAGIERAAVNVHHGRKPFLEFLNGNLPMPITPFVEEPAILETGGGIKNMRSFVTEENFVVANCDFISDIDLKAAVKFHIQRKALATMVLLARPDTHKYKPIGVDAEGKIVAFPYGDSQGKAKTSGMFSGIHVFNRAIFGEMPKEKIFGINRDVYPPLLSKGAPVFGHVTKGIWLDLGETKLYAEAQFALLKEFPRWVAPFLEGFIRRGRGVFVARNAVVAPNVRIREPVMVCEGAEVGSEARLGPNVIVGPGIRVAPNVSLQGSFIHPDLPLKAGGEIGVGIRLAPGLAPSKAKLT